MKKTILFVDDEEINLFVLSKRFQQDYEVLTANTVEEAIHLIENKEIHAMISDFKMPEMTGLEMIEKAKKHLQNVHCFLLTGYDNNPDIDAAINSNTITKLFKKPFDYNEISRTLKEYLY